MQVTLTDRAAEEILQKLAEDGDVALRIAAVPSCGEGHSYVVSGVSEGPGEDDEVLEDHGVAIYVGAESVGFVDGTAIDYGEDEGVFMVVNPNHELVCFNCGRSFRLKTGDTDEMPEELE